MDLTNLNVELDLSCTNIHSGQSLIFKWACIVPDYDKVPSGCGAASLVKGGESCDLP